jgi:hypothetical protein
MKYMNVLFCSLSLLLSIGAARAEDPTVEEMVCALNPQCSMPFADRRVRGITATTQVVRPPASFDITLNFPFNSAEITADSREKRRLQHPTRPGKRAEHCRITRMAA